MLDFSIYSTTSKYCDDSIALFVVKMKFEIGGVAVEELIGLK